MSCLVNRIADEQINIVCLCFSIYVSKRKLKRMVDLNQIKAKFAARVEGVVLIDSDEGLVTIFHKTQRKKYH